MFELLPEMMIPVLLIPGIPVFMLPAMMIPVMLIPGISK